MSNPTDKPTRGGEEKNDMDVKLGTWSDYPDACIQAVDHKEKKNPLDDSDRKFNDDCGHDNEKLLPPAPQGDDVLPEDIKCLFVGHSGAGKTSLIHTMLRNHDVVVPTSYTSTSCLYETMYFRARDTENNVYEFRLDMIEVPAECMADHLMNVCIVVLVTDAEVEDVRSPWAVPRRTLSDFMEDIRAVAPGVHVVVIENKNDETACDPLDGVILHHVRGQRKFENKWCMQASCKTGVKKVRTELKTWLQRNAVYAYLRTSRHNLAIGDNWVVESA